MDIAEFVVIRIVRYGYAELQFMQYSIHTLKNHSKFTFLKITSFTFTLFLAGHMISSKSLVLFFWNEKLLESFSKWPILMTGNLLGYIFFN